MTATEAPTQATGMSIWQRNVIVNNMLDCQSMANDSWLIGNDETFWNTAFNTFKGML